MDLIPGLPNDVAIECLIRIPFDQCSKAASVCRAWNREINQPEFRRRRKVSGLTRPVIVMAQAIVGLSGLYPPVYRLTVFEPMKGCWYDLQPIPEMVEGLPLFSRVIGFGSDLAVIGGCDPETWRVMNSVFIYNFLSATWRRGADMPGEQRLFFGCAASEEEDGGVVVVAGGHDDDKNALKSALAYDVAGDKWTALPDMSSGRDECACVFHRGEFHVIGGYDVDTQGQFKQTAETLGIVSREWRVTEKITDAANMTGAYVEINGKIHAITLGGDVVALEDATWVVVVRVPEEICNVAYVTGWQGKMMVIGNPKYGEVHRAYALEVKSKKWSKIETPSEYCGHVQSGCCIEL